MSSNVQNQTVQTVQMTRPRPSVHALPDTMPGDRRAALIEHYRAVVAQRRTDLPRWYALRLLAALGGEAA